MHALRRHPAALDALVAAALLALAQVESWLSPETAGRRPEVAAFAAVMTISLAFRRSHPLGSVAGTMAGFAGLSLTGDLPTVTFLLPVGLLSMYSCGAHATGERAVIGLGIALATVGLGASSRTRCSSTPSRRSAPRPADALPRGLHRPRDRRVDGQENPLATILASKFYEVQKHTVSRTTSTASGPS